MDYRITEHPILPIPEKTRLVKFTWNGEELEGIEGMVISSVLFSHGIKIFGHHAKDQSPQGIFCANGQCSQCTVIVDGKPLKACMTPLQAGMVIQSLEGLPQLPAEDETVETSDVATIKTEVLVIGAGPSGLAASKILADYGVKVLLIDDKDRLGGKLVLQTHKFFGSQQDVYAGKRGFEIGKILGDLVQNHDKIDVWLNSTAVAVFSDGIVGVWKGSDEYALIKPNFLFVATGAREKMLAFPGDTLPGVYGAGAFQTLVNRDLVKASENIFIVGGGNVGLIAGYHAIQAGINVIGLVEALPKCGGYKVHEDKLRRLGVPIYTRHTILSANGSDHVESITIAQLDDNWKVIQGTEKTYACDTILIAVGLSPVDEFYQKAKTFGIKTFVAGDAQEIAEASAAIFTGRVEAIRMLNSMGIKTKEDLTELERKAQIMKARPPEPINREVPSLEEGIFPLFHCNQEIPCNPCTSVCPNDLIHTEDDLITNLPYFSGDKDCIGCGRCVAVCPGLAITLLDYRKSEDPLVTFPFEIATRKMTKGEKITVMSDEGPLGEFVIQRTRILKEYPRTQLVTVKLPKNIAKLAVNIRFEPKVSIKPLDIYHKAPFPDDAIICRCERVTAGEIRKWIRAGVTDVNELKTLTRAQMGACGGKTCTALIERLYREEGIPLNDYTPGTLRPLFVEVPMGVFAKAKGGKK
ncbi:MAG: FAD-dependent oxidoreductase [Candidatus Hodarchaeales archaeon]